MERGKVILSQDPSFAKLAFCLYDGEDTVYVNNCSFSFGSDILGFEAVFNANNSIWSQYEDKLENLYKVSKDLYIDIIVSEIPPPNGMFAAGLYSLDTFILDRLWRSNERCREIWTLPPSFLMTLHNSKSYKKSESSKLAKYFMDTVLKDDFDFKIASRDGYKIEGGQINADRAESFLFLLKMFVKFNVKGTKEKIIRDISGFLSESEKLLICR